MTNPQMDQPPSVEPTRPERPGESPPPHRTILRTILRGREGDGSHSFFFRGDQKRGQKRRQGQKVKRFEEPASAKVRCF